MLIEIRNKAIPLLIFANKMDLKDAISSVTVSFQYYLKLLNTKQIILVSISPSNSAPN